MHMPYVSPHVPLLYGKGRALAMYLAKAQGLCHSRLLISHLPAPSSLNVSSWFQQYEEKTWGNSMLGEVSRYNVIS